MNDDGSNETRLTNNVGLDTNPIFTPDGSKILFLSARPNASGVYMMNADGSNQTLLPTSVGVMQPAFSPDGSKVVFVNNGDIYAMNSDGTNPVQLTNTSASDSEPSFSSDGSKIVYCTSTNGFGSIYTMNADGTNQTLLPNVVGVSDPIFSADGNRVLFVRSGITSSVNLDGTDKKELTAGGDYTPAISSDGRKLFVSSFRNENRDIYVSNADGSNPTQLTLRRGFDPNWAIGSVPVPNPPPTPTPPISGKITFSATRNGNTDIYVMNADGTGETRLTTETAIDKDPCFSPDGSKIVFQSARNGNSDIYVMDFDGANQTRLTFSTGDETAPAFSSDGSKIAFLSGTNVAYMDADGRNRVLIASSTDAPSFSPDGSKIVFSVTLAISYVDIIERTSPKTITGMSGQYPAQPIFSKDGSRVLYFDYSGLASIKLDGTDQKSLMPEYGTNRSICLSPDGSRIAMSSVRNNQSDIYILYSDGTGVKRLTTQGGQFPSWAPVYVRSTEPPTPAPSVSGKIVFDSTRDGNSEIYVMNADGTNQTRLTNNSVSDNKPIFSPDGSKILYLSKSDNTAGELYLMNADGSNSFRLTENEATETNFLFSPEGSNIVYQYVINGQSINAQNDIYSVKADGTGNTRLTTDTTSSTPAFSPDGKSIVFSKRVVSSYQIYVMKADGTNPISLTTGFNNYSAPVFSPDGTKIAFESSNTQSGICLMNADGTNLKQLTIGVGGVGSYPRFSPDSNKVLFLRTTTRETSDIMSVNVDGSNLRQLTLGGQAIPSHSISPDGTHFTVSTNLSGIYQIYTVAINGSYQIQRTTLNGKNPDWSIGSVPAPAARANSSVKSKPSTSINAS